MGWLVLGKPIILGGRQPEFKYLAGYLERLFCCGHFKNFQM
uniref:Uncharacterized protein n=1 Tax=Rhizophora mucronata TaxID=61149 RepID=A0A2P2NGH7_RHIMU